VKLILIIPNGVDWLMGTIIVKNFYFKNPTFSILAWIPWRLLLLIKLIGYLFYLPLIGSTIAIKIQFFYIRDMVGITIHWKDRNYRIHGINISGKTSCLLFQLFNFWMILQRLDNYFIVYLDNNKYILYEKFR